MAKLWFSWFEYYHAYRSGNTFNECLLWCWSKICGSLDEILSLTMGSYESKILNKFQGSRLRRPSILNTRYFRFGRKFRLSVRPSGRDFYEGNISALEANFGVRKRRYASNIYNTENKLYILKLNGFERFPGKLFTSTIVKRDISYTSISTQNVIYRKKA